MKKCLSINAWHWRYIYDIDIIYNIDGSTDVIVTYLSEVKTFLIGDRSYNTKTTEKAWYHLEGVDITCKAKLVATFYMMEVQLCA